jgi:hypothetical protein
MNQDYLSVNYGVHLMVPPAAAAYRGNAGLTAKEEKVMGVQTDLRAGTYRQGSCSRCGSLVYIDNDTNIAFNVQFSVFGDNIFVQHND